MRGSTDRWATVAPRGRKTLAVGALLGLAVVGAPASAEGQEPDVVTFEAAVERAMRLSTDLLRARTDVDLRQTLESRERMDFLPRVSVSSRGGRSFGRSFSQQEGQILSETNDVFDAGLSASITLFDGMERFASLGRASLEEEASRLRLDRVRQDVLFAVVEGFIGLVEARELETVRREELVAADELREQVRRLVDAGRAPLSDLYQQQAAFAEAEAALVEVERQRGLAETVLIQVLQLDPLGTYDFRVPTPPLDVESADPKNVASLLEAAWANRTDLEASERTVAAAGRGVDAASASRWPSLSLSFDYGSNWSGSSLQPIPGTGSDPRTVTVTPDGGGEPVTFRVPGTGSDPRFYQPSFLDQLDARRGGSVSLALSVPLFDGLQTRAAVAQAEAARSNARYDLEDRRQQVALQVRQAVLEYRSAVAQRAAAGRRLAAAERAWDAAERRYELGAATFVEVAQARSVLVSARSAAIRARFGVLLAERRIDYQTGTLEGDSLLLGTIEEDDDA